MIENIKKYWFLYGFLAGAVIWIATIDSRTFDSPEQKVEHKNHVKNSLTPVQQEAARLIDSFNNQHAIQTRQRRYEDNKIKDSLRTINDSLFLDMVKRQTVQIEQIKERLEQNN